MFVSVPATSANLGPGFDTLGLAVDLRNEIIIKPSKFLSISTHGEGSDNPKIKKNTLFLSIFNENYKRLTGRTDNFRFEFHNRIPISRGLGSSSAVIVAALSAAYTTAGVRYNKREILNQALRYEHHPDNITPAVMGGFNVACVEGDRVYSKKRRLPDYLNAVVVVPNRTISTAKSRTVLPKMYRKEETVYSLSRAAYMTALFMSESWDLLRIASKDKLHQARRMKMMPELFEVQKTALKHGAVMSTLSGSGSTFFNLVYEKDAQKIHSALQSRFPQFRVFTLALDNNGVMVKS
ncbi:homoserine kinase [Sulfurovum sp. ST-21]|uniref:Homoserine kinase n=1 Tax=Sulfurovum indicum TaxID=2779528 RepID=A0A7M1S6I2_9BACT|nr:homoserine kinase [Sulfurovum indicum]QOR62309.1 homoserine kinase [Sulfurovum indicum]